MRWPTAGDLFEQSRQSSGSSGLGRRSMRFLVNSEWRRTVIFSISCRARTQVSSVDLMAPSRSAASAISRARSAARAGASGGPSLPGGGPSFSIWDLTAASCGRSVSAVCVDSERIVSTSTRSPPELLFELGQVLDRLFGGLDGARQARDAVGDGGRQGRGLRRLRLASAGAGCGGARRRRLSRGGRDRTRSQPGARRGEMRR